MLSKRFMIISIILLFISIAAVSAASEEQLNDNVTISSQKDIVLDTSIDDVNNDENISSSYDNDLLGVSNLDDDILEADSGTLADLRNKINNAAVGSTVLLENNYNFGSVSSGTGININKNLTIDGQGFTIDANRMGRIFYVSGYNVTLKNLILKNSFYSSQGSAIYFAGNIFTVENCTFESNENTHTEKGGAAIYSSYRNYGLIHITNSTFTKNSVQHGGGALYFDNANNLQTDYNVYITNCDFNQNSAGPRGYGGGAIFNFRGINLHIDSSRFVANEAKGKDGGAIRYSGSVEVINSEFYYNKAAYGAALCLGQQVDLKISNSTFANNIATEEGGAVKARFFDIDGVKFINNTANKGGALFSRHDSASLFNSYFFNNTAGSYGGGLYVSADVANLNMYNNDFIKNTAGDSGGAIYSDGKNVVTSVTNLTSNTAKDGGAIYINQGKFTISDSTLENNTATNEGGAINVRSDNVEIRTSILKDNRALLGGAIFWYGNNGKVLESTFVSNKATNSSSINWRGNYGTIEKSSFNDGNITLGSVFWHGIGGTISQSTFLTSKAIYICEHGDATLNRNTELSPESGDYIVYVGNKAYFNSNNFNNLIYNYGLITSSTYMVTLDNTTKISNSDSVVVYTTILDDNNNTIKVSDNIVNVYESNNLPTTFNGTHYVSTISGLKIGEHRISSTGYNASRFADLTIQTGGLLYLIINLTVNQTNYGEKVVITTTLVNTTYNGTIDLALNDIHYNVTLTNGTAILTLYNLAPNTYEITATYMEFNQSISANIEIKVELRNSTLNVTANNVYYGNITTININVTNGTTGSIYLFVNNKMYIVNLVNSTGQLNLTNLAGGNYTVYALYTGDAYFEGCHNNTTFAVYKYKPQINITVSDIYAGQIATIKVDIDNDATGKLYVDIGDKEYIYTNKTSVTIYESNLTAGNISVRAYYLGNNKYYESNATAYFNVTKKNMTMRIETADIPMGENATISVIIPSDAKGIVLLSVNGTNYFEYANGTVAKFIISGLSKGVYNVTAIYAEGPIYNEANVSSSFKVNYVHAYDFNVTATSDNNLTVYVNISLPKDIDGDVYVEINGTNYTAHMSKGRDIVVIPGLTGGEYNGTVYLVNDSKYYSSNRSFTIDLIKISPNIHLTYNHTIFVGDDAIIKVKINDDATGNITITINNTNYTEEIKNGESVFNITGLVWHTYQFNVTYDGDRKYLPEKKVHTLEVSRIHNYYSNLEVHDIFVGENATIKVTFENDTTGQVILLINGTTHTINLKNGTGSINISGLPVGKHIINATYVGDNKYEPCNRIFEDFHVNKIINYPFRVDNVVNDTGANITVFLPDDADGYVNITINGTFYPDIEVKNGRANLTVNNLEAGKIYVAKIDYSGNGKYEPGSRNVTLNSTKTSDYEFIVQGDSIHVGDVAHIIVTIPESVDGDHVIIRVEGRTDPYNMFIQNHTVNCSVINLKEGEYYVTVEYDGNDQLESSVRSTHIYVSKISSFKFDVVANEPYVGENLTIDIQLPTDSTGKVNVTVSINNTNYTANVTNGSARVNIPNLPAGVYNATVYYSGDDKYHSAVKTIEVVVEKIDDYVFVVTPVNIYVGQNETIKIVLPKDINGTVTIRIFNTTYVDRVVSVVNGTGWFNVSDLSIGDYVVYVSLKNDGKYEDDTVYSNFKVSPIDDYLFEVEVSDPNYVRDNVTFTVHLPFNATGNVTITVFAKDYYGVVKEGVAIVNITAKEYGTFPYRVSFEETGKYALKSQTGSVVISKLNVDLNPEFKSQVEVDENITFKVQLPKDATGTITIITRMMTYIKTLVNGSANITVPGYPLAQNYSPSISYSGDDRYNPNSTALNVIVNKVSDYELTVNVSDINVGQIEVVNITLPVDATDDVLIYGNFSTRTYSQAINKGNVTFRIADLPAGTYNITVVYQGFNKYESKNVTKVFRVSKVNSTIAIELVNKTIVVTVPDDATGNVTISISDIKRNVTIDKGKATLDVSNIYPGQYLVNASFAGDVKYLGNKTSKIVHIPKINDYLINVTVENIIVGENATVFVNLPNDANGFANITVNNTLYPNVEVKSGIAKLNVTNLAVGNYNVFVNYTDNKYAFNTNKTKFNVNKINTILSMSVSVENQTANITVRITENATGNITVYVDGNPYSIEIKDNKVNLTLELMPGDHTIQASYAGDTNYTSTNTQLYLIEIDHISDYDLLIDLTELITVVENNNITVTLPEKAHGTINIYVNDDVYDVEINKTTHKATVTLPYLMEGNYTVRVSYSDELYAHKENSSDFRVIKLNTTISVEVANITKDLSEIINITLINENVTGYVLINVSGIVYHETLVNGNASITLSNLDDGNYTVIVTYEGDNFYNLNSTLVNFTVSKIPVAITVNASDIIVGHVLNIKFNMSRAITDAVIVEVGQTNHTAFVYKGNGNLEVYNLPVGDYNITVYYEGDKNYLPASNRTNITVTGKKTSQINVSVADITVGENITVYINTTEPINGTVYVTIRGLAYTSELLNGRTNFNVSNLKADYYTISAFFMGNDDYNLCNATSNFTVHKKNTNIDLEVVDINIGQYEIINVTVNKNATGSVSISIGTLNIFANLTEGKASAIIRNLAVGEYNVTVTYVGDDNFNSNKTKANFTVSKLDPEVSISLHKVLFSLGEDVIIYLTGPDDVTGVVTVTVGNTMGSDDYTAYINNGVGTLTLKDLDVDVYNVSAFYQDNYKYLAKNTAKIAFEVYQNGTNISVTTHNIKVGENEIIIVTFPKGKFEGNVTIYVDENPYNATLVYNATTNITKATLTLPANLKAGTYDVQATYLFKDEEGKIILYEGSNEFTVSKINSTITINPISDIRFGENTSVIMILDSGDATGDIHVYVNGVLHSVDATNPILELNNLPRAHYYIQAFYMGDDKYLPSEAEAEFNVTKANPDIKLILPDNPTAFSDTLIKVTINDTATSYINLVINGQDHLLEINGGQVNLTINSILPNTYDIVAYYIGDSNYYNATVSGSFKVTNEVYNATIKVTVDDIYVGENATVKVNVTGEPGVKYNETIIVTINNTEYIVTVEKGFASFNVTGLAPGQYSVLAILTENANYTKAYGSDIFTVKKLNVPISVDDMEIIYGEKATVILKDLENIVGDEITITITGKGSKTVKVNASGMASATFDDLAVGVYGIVADYAGNTDYDANTTTATLTVLKANSNISIEVESIYAVGDKIVIKFLVDNSTGNITVTINGKSYKVTNNNVTIDNGLGAGEYIINAILAGDENYTGSSANATFEVIKLNTTIFTYATTPREVGSPFDIGAVLGHTVTGDVVFTINGVNYTVKIVNDYIAVVVYTPVNNDTVNVVATFMGDDKYNNISTTGSFDVVKVPTEIEVTVKEPVTYGENAVISIELDAPVNTTVKLTVDGTDYNVGLINGKGSYNVSGLNAGLHKVNVAYAGDAKYIESNNGTTFTIDQVVLDANVVALNVTVEQNTSFVIDVPNDFKGNVSISVDGNVLYNGSVKSVINAAKLVTGDKTATVVFYGDSNYDELTLDNVKFTVSGVVPKITVKIDDVTYPDNAVAVITLSINVNGTVNVTVDDKVFSGTVENGKASVNLTGLNAGVKVADVVFFPTDGHIDTITASIKFNVNKAGSSIDIDVKDTYYVDEGIVITLRPTNSTGVSVTINGKEYTVTNNEVVIPNGLANGTYLIVAKIDGDDNYYASEANATFGVNKLVPTNVKAEDLTFVVGNEGILEISGPDDRTASLIVNVGGVDYYVELNNGKSSLDVSELSVGEYNVNITYIENDKYIKAEFSNAATITVNDKNKTDVNVTVDVENKTITLDLPENATGNVTVIIDGKVYNVTDVTESPVIIDITDLEPGNHTIEVIYSGDDNFNPAVIVSDVEVPKVDDYEITVDAKVDGNSVDIIVTLPENVTGHVLIDVDGVGYYANVTDGQAKLHLDDLSAGDYDVVVKYPGDDYYAPKENSTSFTIEGSEIPINIDVEDDKLVIELPEDATGNMTVTIDGKNYNVPIKDGKAVFDLPSDLEPGNYTVDVKYSGDDKYPPASNSTTVDIPKIDDYPINVTNAGDELVIDVPEDATGDVTVTIDGKNYTVPIKDGKAVIDISDLPAGVYDVKVTYPGNNKYAPRTVNTSIDKKRKLVITAPDVVKYYSGPERFYVYFTEDGKNVDGLNVKITINGVTYERTSKDGKVSLALNLHSGNFTTKVEFAGTSEYEPQTVYANVEILPTIFAKDVVKEFRNATQYYALFVDGEGNPLVNTNVFFNIHGVFYNKKTDANGWAKLDINLERGEYILTATNPVTGEKKSNKITVISLIVENNDIIKYFRNGTQYTARIVLPNGSYAGAGEAVTLNINGVLYTRYTDANGYVKLNINLERGDYIITAYYRDCAESNNIKVLPTLITGDLVMDYGDGSQFIAQVLDGQGNPYSNQHVSFNVHGILYNRMSDSNGFVKLDVNLQRGEYLITSSCNGEEYSNKIIIH